MYDILVKLIVGAALVQLGLVLTDRKPDQTPLQNIQQASRRVLQIDWRPISVFPEEAARFNGASSSGSRGGHK